MYKLCGCIQRRTKERIAHVKEEKAIGGWLFGVESVGDGTKEQREEKNAQEIGVRTQSIQQSSALRRVLSLAEAQRPSGRWTVDRMDWMIAIDMCRRSKPEQRPFLWRGEWKTLLVEQRNQRANTDIGAMKQPKEREKRGKARRRERDPLELRSRRSSGPKGKRNLAIRSIVLGRLLQELWSTP